VEVGKHDLELLEQLLLGTAGVEFDLKNLHAELGDHVELLHERVHVARRPEIF